MKSKRKKRNPSAGIPAAVVATKPAMFMASSNFSTFDRINPFTQMTSNPCGTGKGYKKR